MGVTPILPNSLHGLSRRRLMAMSGAFSLVGLTGRAAYGATDVPLHIEVAEKAKALATPGAILKMLIPQGSEANIRPVIEKFQDLSGVKLTTKSIAVDEMNAQLSLDGISGTANYDLALPATFGIPDLASAGVILPLTAYAKYHEPDGFRDDILYSTGDTFDAETYGFQADGDAYVMFYNKDWLEDPTEQARFADQHGHVLEIPRTWEELDRQMAYFHRPEEGRYGGALFRTPGYLAWEWWLRFHAKGIWPLSADLEPQIASDAGIEALEEMMRATQSLYPQARSAGLFENWKHYGAGNTFANIGWGGSQKYLNGPKSKIAGRMLYSLTPSGYVDGVHVNLPYFNWGWNYVVTTASTQPELAYLFALFASTSEISTLAVREQEGYFDPVRSEHYVDPVIQKIYSREFLDVHRKSMENAIPDLYLAQQSEYFQVLSKWLDAAVNGDTNPAEALQRVSTQWSLLNLRVGKASQTARWRELKTKYPQNAQKVFRDLP
ncbi:MAG: ABC transporter substrate-binding protein [Paracoccaceae bacterium]